jgi:hypothetical protein
MANLTKAKFDSTCAVCGKPCVKGEPIYWTRKEGEDAVAWHYEHGENAATVSKAPETALEGTEDLKRIADSLDALLTGISKDFELSRLDARGIYDELKGIKIVLEQLKMQGAK